MDDKMIMLYIFLFFVCFDELGRKYILVLVVFIFFFILCLTS